MKFLLPLVLAFVVTACGKDTVTPLGPSPVAPVQTQTMAYAINVPDTLTVVRLNAQYPQGVHVAPLTAQAQWDYSANYAGTPNVYAGEVAPCGQNYLNTSVVIAPPGVAGKASFSAQDWPGAHLDANTIYEWVGTFVVAYAAAPGTYKPCGS